jgi:iron(III) transport system ATP-binding protein
MYLSVSSATKSFGSEEILRHLSFEMREQEIFALLGPSGCGKTTLLRAIAGLERLDHGKICLKGQILQHESTFVKPEKRGIGFVFQDYALFPHFTVAQNIQFGLFKLPKNEQAERVQEMAKRVGLHHLLHRKPHELSGGQQQRVALARAMAQMPNLLLLDEPFSGLDALLREETREEVRQVLKSAKMSAILVTHDQEEALSFADRIAVMRKGNLEQVGTPEALYDAPQTLFVAQFLGKTNLISGVANGSFAQTAIGNIPLPTPQSGDVFVALRPEYIRLKRCEEATATIISKEFKGHDISYRLAMGATTFIAHTDNIQRFSVGDKVGFEILKEGVLLSKGKV